MSLESDRRYVAQKYSDWGRFLADEANHYCPECNRNLTYSELGNGKCSACVWSFPAFNADWDCAGCKGIYKAAAEVLPGAPGTLPSPLPKITEWEWDATKQFFCYKSFYATDDRLKAVYANL